MQVVRCVYCGAQPPETGPCLSSSEHAMMSIAINDERCREVARTLNEDELVWVLADMINRGKGRQLALALKAQFPWWHRTLQQLAMGSLALPIIEGASLVKYPDARNEASVRIAWKMVAAAPPPWALPFI